MSILTISYKLLGVLAQPIADDSISDLLEQMGDVFKLFLAILVSLVIMIIIGTTIVINISNNSMMYS